MFLEIRERRILVKQFEKLNTIIFSNVETRINEQSDLTKIPKLG